MFPGAGGKLGEERSWVGKLAGLEGSDQRTERDLLPPLVVTA
jgi:hypothetical protein